jgi:hypothetical protein
VPPVQRLFELSVPLDLLPGALAIGAVGAMAVQLVGMWAARVTARGSIGGP